MAIGGRLRYRTSHTAFSVAFPLVLYVVCNALNIDKLSRWFAQKDGLDLLGLSAYLLAGLCLTSPWQAAITAAGVAVAALSATAIQLWFRVQARRSQFRRRQTSSRLATFAEAFCSIGWAATSALVLAIPIAGIISGLLTAGALAATWKFSPQRE